MRKIQTYKVRKGKDVQIVRAHNKELAAKVAGHTLSDYVLKKITIKLIKGISHNKPRKVQGYA